MKRPLNKGSLGAREHRSIGETALVTKGRFDVSEKPSLNKKFSDAPTPRGSDTVVLGVDPGLATTGWGVVRRQGSDATLIAFGVILSPARTALPERLRHIRSELAALIAWHRPVVLAIEQLFFAKFATAIAATAQARGIILLAAAEADVPVVEYNPRTVKIALTGFGSASKIQMQAMVQSRFSLKAMPQPDDAADALAIALCHVQTWREPKTEREQPKTGAGVSIRNLL